MTDPLGLISSTLHVTQATGGIRYTQRGFAIGELVSDKDLIEAGNRLFAAKSYLNWALGSVFAEMLARKRDRKEHNEPGVHFDDAWLAQYTEGHALDPKEKRELLGVFQFYARAGDTPPLSYEHHREAMWGAANGQPGELNRAIAYLDRAHKEGLTYTQLRRVIRKEKVTEKPEPKQAELAHYSAVFDFMRFAKRELDKVSDYTPQQAKLILADLGEPTLSYIDALREIAAQAAAR